MRAKYNNDKLKLREYFDLIAGTSTGSILAAGIACGMDADDLIDIYKKRGQDIFLESVRWQRIFRPVSRFFGSNGLYPHKEGEDKGLANVLKKKLKLYKDRQVVNEFPTMADIEETQLLILAYDVSSRNTTWFANDDSEEWWYASTKLWEICTASSSAPTFFPPYKLDHPRIEGGLIHIDGGVSANDPILLAIAHALSIKEKDKNRNNKIERPKTIDDIAVLSIGTGQVTRPDYTSEQMEKWGLLNWAQNIANILLDSSADNSEYISKRMFLGIKPENYLRLNFKLEKYVNLKEEWYHKIKIIKEQKEQIDNPNICENLTEAAKAYLERGKVEYNKKQYNNEEIPVQDAIEKFFYNVEHPNEN